MAYPLDLGLWSSAESPDAALVKQTRIHSSIHGTMATNMLFEAYALG